jgi:hypothetical protein
VRLLCTRQAILAVPSAAIHGGGGLPLINAEDYNAPFGKPVLQVDAMHGDAILAAARHGPSDRVSCNLVAALTQRASTDSEGINVECKIEGTSGDRDLAPILVITPRSGWWGCAVERGCSLAAWVEMIRAVRAARPLRSVIFKANTGHEISHAGSRETSPDAFRNAHLTIHLGANWAFKRMGQQQHSDRGEPAQLPPSLIVQVSDEPAASLVLGELQIEGLSTQVCTVCPQLLFALDYCLPSTVCPQLKASRSRSR